MPPQELGMNLEQGILSAAQMGVETGGGGSGDEEEDEVCDERVGAEAPGLAEESPLRRRVLHEEDAMQEGEGGGEEGEGDGDGEGGDGDDEAAGDGEVGDGAGSRLTKPKKLAISQLTKIHWPSGELCHVLMELVSTGGSAPNILSLGARAVLPDGSSPASPVFHAYVSVRVTANKEATRQVHGLDLADVQTQARGNFLVVGRAWLDWLKQAVPMGKPCAVVSWGGFKGGDFSLLMLELARVGLALPSSLSCFVDIAALNTAMKKKVDRVRTSIRTRVSWPCP